MNTQHDGHDLPHALRALIAAALDANIAPSRIKDLIRLERRAAPGHCPECRSAMRAEQGPSLRCTNCGVTSACE